MGKPRPDRGTAPRRAVPEALDAFVDAAVARREAEPPARLRCKVLGNIYRRRVGSVVEFDAGEARQFEAMGLVEIVR